MEAFGIFLLKSAVWLTGFTLVFLVFLRNERYFRLNRAYLLSGIFASVVFPFYTWHYAVILPSLPVSEISFPDVTEQLTITAPATATSPGIPFYWWLYIVGIAFLAVRMIWQTAKVIGKLRRNGYVKNGPVKLVRTPEYSASFSFFSFVFVNPSTSDTEMKEILNHERGHIQKRHWFDLLLVELLRIMQWFNPFAWVYAHLVRQNHEYLADEMALQRTSNPAIYRAALLNQMLGVPVISLANSFSYSLNKQRFKMMKKKINSPFRKLRMLMVLPLIALVFYAFAKPEYKYTSNENQDSSSISVIAQNDLYYIEKDSVNILFTSQFKKSDLWMIKAKLAEVGIEIEYTSMQFTEDGNLKQLSASYKDSKGSGSFVSGDLGPTEGPRLILKSHPYEFGVDLPHKKSSELSKSLNHVELAKFLILVETTNEGIKLTSLGGCVWKELSFSIPGSQSQAIDENGMTTNKTKEASLNSSFLFTITKTENGLSFKGIKGTSWSNLTFTCPKGNCHQAINQNGMTKRETANANLQQKAGKVKGKVTAEDGKPLQGAVVVIRGTTVGTVTDTKGKFALKDVPPDADLQISYVGLKTAQVKPDFKQTMNVILDISTQALQNVIVGPDQPYIRIRSIDSENPPMILLDGRIITKSEMEKIKPDDIFSISVWKDKSATEKYGEQGKNGVIVITTKSHASETSGKPFNDITVTGYADQQKNQADAQKEKKPAYTIVEQMPQFPGGERRLMYYLSVELKYPAKAKADKIEGTVVVNFMVNSTGKIENVKVIKSFNPELDAEAVRVVGSMPDWSPGKQNGKPVDVYYSIPIEFSLKSAGEKSRANPSTLNGDPEVVVVGYGTNRSGEQKKYDADSLLNSLPKKDDQKPLIMLDGRIIEMSEIKKEDIDIIHVFKDESALKRFGEKGKNGVIVITSKQETQRHIIDGEQPFVVVEQIPQDMQRQIVDGERAFVVVEQMPQFPGGENAMREFIQKTLKYPEEAKKAGIQGTVIVNFIIDKQGKIRNTHILRGKLELIDEAIRVINSMPAWIPGKQGGKPVPVSYTVPIKFALN